MLHHVLHDRREEEGILSKVIAATRPGGTIVVVDVCRDASAAHDDAFALMGGLGARMSVDEWVSFFADRLDPIKMSMVRPGTVCIQLAPPVRI